MKFEKVIPAYRKGKEIRRKCWNEEKIINHLVLVRHFGSYGQIKEGVFWKAVVNALLKADDWEIVKEKKKVKLRDLTEEQYKTFVDRKCGNQIVGIGCVDCPFYRISCLYGKGNKCWIDNKDLYSDKFLDQEIEVEE